MKKTVYYAHMQTPYGPMLVAGHGKMLSAIKFGVPKSRLDAAAEEVSRELPNANLVPDAAKLSTIMRQLSDYFAGKRRKFDLQLDLAHITPFRRDVLLAAADVPPGEVATYAEIARRVGRPLAARAVGNTMRTNPIPIVIPCHRIIGSDGTLRGFGGGLDMKRGLLALEGASIA